MFGAPSLTSQVSNEGNSHDSLVKTASSATAKDKSRQMMFGSQQTKDFNSLSNLSSSLQPLKHTNFYAPSMLSQHVAAFSSSQESKDNFVQPAELQPDPELMTTGQFSARQDEGKQLNECIAMIDNFQKAEPSNKGVAMNIQDQVNSLSPSNCDTFDKNDLQQPEPKPQPVGNQSKKGVYTEVFVWGNDQFGQLGLGHKYVGEVAPKILINDDDLKKVQEIPGPHGTQNRKMLQMPKSCSFSIQIRDVACGEDFAFLLTKRGLLYAMGSNQFGKLGILSQANLMSGKPGHLLANLDAKDVPFVSTPKLVESLARHAIKKVSCGLNHAVAVTASGLCYSWGCGSHGQLGRPANKAFNLNPPQVVSYFATRSIQIVDVAAGGKHTLFMTEASQVMAAGMNEFGQLGQGDYQYRQQCNVEPLEVANLSDKAKQIACGLVHSQILLNSGRVVSFGDNQFGQLGLGTEAGVNSSGKPIEIPKLSKIQAIACNHHSAAIGARGELYFWGTGVFGTFFSPRIVLDSNIVDVSVGGSFGIARDRDGNLFSWGQNQSGELGLSDLKTRLYPNPITALKQKFISKAVCGGSFAIAIGPDKKSSSLSQISSHRSPHRRKSSPFDNKSELVKMLKKKTQQRQAQPVTEPQQQALNSADVTAQPMTMQQFDNVRIFSARESERMIDSAGSLSQSYQMQTKPSQSKMVLSNQDISGIQKEAVVTGQMPKVGSTAQGTNQSFTSIGKAPATIVSQPELLYKKREAKDNQLHVYLDGRRRSASRQSCSTNRSSQYKQPVVNSLALRQKQQLQFQAKQAGADGLQHTRRSVSPLSISTSNNQSQTNASLATGVSLKSTSTPKLNPQHSSAVFGGSGAVQPPRKRKSTSRGQSHSRNQIIRTTANKLGNTFELAASKTVQPETANINMNSSFGLAQAQGQTELNTSSTRHRNLLEASREIEALQESNSRLTKQVELLQAQLMDQTVRNKSLTAQVAKHRQTMAEYRNQAHHGQPSQVIDQLAEEVQKAHDLEYLLRGKERQIEILRGDVDEARQLKAQAESNLEQVNAQNAQVLQLNEQLEAENRKLTEALEHAMAQCELMRTQRDEYSERFDYLSQEMTSLRGLANDIQSQRQNEDSTRGLNTQKHTANKPSFVNSNNHKKNASNNAVIDTHENEQPYNELSSQLPGCHNQTTLGHTSFDGTALNRMKKLEPIVEEKFTKRQPETTKNQSKPHVSHADAMHKQQLLPQQSTMGDIEARETLQIEETNQDCGEDQPQHSYYADEEQQKQRIDSINGASDLHQTKRQQAQQHQVQSIVSGSFPVSTSNGMINNHEPYSSAQFSEQSSEQLQQFKSASDAMQYINANNHSKSFSMQDLAIDPNIAKTLDIDEKTHLQHHNQQAKSYRRASKGRILHVEIVDTSGNKQHHQMDDTDDMGMQSQNLTSLGEARPTTGMHSNVDRTSNHFDNKEQHMRRRCSSRQSKSKSVSKNRSKRVKQRKKSATAAATIKENINSSNFNRSSRGRSVSKEKNNTLQSKASSQTFSGLTRKQLERGRSYSNEKSTMRSHASKASAVRETIKRFKVVAQEVEDEELRKEMTRLNPSMTSKDLRRVEDRPGQLYIQQDSSMRQINLTVESINKLAEIINTTNNSSSNIATANNFASAAVDSSQQNGSQQLQSSMMRRDDQSILYTANQNQADHSVLIKSPITNNGRNHQLDQSSIIGNNPMLTLSGHDIQAVVSSHHHQNQCNPQLQPQQMILSSDKQRQSFLQVDQIESEDAMSPSLPSRVANNPFQREPREVTDLSRRAEIVAVSDSSFRQSSQPAVPKRHVGQLIEQSATSSMMLSKPAAAGQLLGYRHRGSIGLFDQSSASPVIEGDNNAPFRKSQLVIGTSYGRSRSHEGSRSMPAVARKKETIDNFKNKLSRLERNKQELEKKMKLFDEKVKSQATANPESQACDDSK